MKTLLPLISAALLPAVALATEASEEPSMLEAVIPFAVIGLMLVVLGPLVARKKK